MNYNIKSTGVELAADLRDYAEKKLAHAGKLLDADPTAHADIELEHASSREGDKNRAEFTVSASGAVYRAEAWGSTMFAAIDVGVAELVKELSRGKKKRLHLLRRGAGRMKDIVRGFTDRF
ncbi:MAG TPA: ribosome-associated translation inhibitor RaiA [Candidatus Paceibacterota bacterium]|nr:ribosome-associated translation inhibitor RaiA [Candidatus Paceibacterota bacterium]